MSLLISGIELDVQCAVPSLSIYSGEIIVSPSQTLNLKRPMAISLFLLCLFADTCALIFQPPYLQLKATDLAMEPINQTATGSKHPSIFCRHGVRAFFIPSSHPLFLFGHYVGWIERHFNSFAILWILVDGAEVSCCLVAFGQFRMAILTLATIVPIYVFTHLSTLPMLVGETPSRR